MTTVLSGLSSLLVPADPNASQAARTVLSVEPKTRELSERCSNIVVMMLRRRLRTLRKLPPEHGCVDLTVSEFVGGTILQQHSRIWVTSEVDKRPTFYFVLAE